jgi:hypothetical protein
MLEAAKDSNRDDLNPIISTETKTKSKGVGRVFIVYGTTSGIPEGFQGSKFG